MSKFWNFQAAIFLILAIAAFLRLYHLPQSFIFAGDEEYQALLAQSLIKDFHIIWIGVNAAHLGFYLGPFWAYFTALWLWISKGDPLITGYISSFIGILTTFLVIYVGSKLFNKKAGIQAGILYATLPLMVFYDQKYWNLTLIPLLSLCFLLSLYKIKENPLYLILFSFSAGLVFHTHLSLLPVILLGLGWIPVKKIKLPKKIVFSSIIIFLILISPLIVFDYFHKGSNITTPLRIGEITRASENKINPKHHLTALFQTLGRIWFIKPVSNNADEVIISCTYSSRTDTLPILKQISTRFNPPIWLSILGLLILLLLFFSKQSWKKESSTLLSLIILSIMISFLFFPGGAFEYYLLGTFPLILFIPSLLAGYYPKFQKFIFLLIITCILLGSYTLLTNSPGFGLENKKILIRKVIEKIDNQPFELKQTGICHFYEGWRYLFVLNGRKPERSDSDKGLGWHYRSEITDKKVQYIVIMAEKRVPANFDVSKALVIEQGGFKAYLIKVVD